MNYLKSITTTAIIASAVIATTHAKSLNLTIDLNNINTQNAAVTQAIKSGHLSATTGSLSFNVPTTVTDSTYTNVSATFASGTTAQTQDGEAFTLTNFQIRKLTKAAAKANDGYVGGVKFGLPNLGLYFNKPVGITVPVAKPDGKKVRFKIKHQGDRTYNKTGLTADPTSTCTNGVASKPSNKTRVSNGTATIYTCRASEFVVVNEPAPAVATQPARTSGKAFGSTTKNTAKATTGTTTTTTTTGTTATTKKTTQTTGSTATTTTGAHTKTTPTLTASGSIFVATTGDTAETVTVFRDLDTFVTTKNFTVDEQYAFAKKALTAARTLSTDDNVFATIADAIARVINNNNK